MAVGAELLRVPPNIEVRRIKPSHKIREDIAIFLGLVELLEKGFDHTDSDLNLIEETVEQLNGKDSRTTNYVATSDEKVTGWLAIEQWTPQDEENGKAFWENLLGMAPIIQRRALAFSPLAIHVTLAVVHPEFRRQGVVQKLFRFAIGDNTPSFVLGGTKRPEAVVSRASALAKSGYRTFFGDTEVTPQRPLDHTLVHIPVMDSFARAIDIYEKLGENGLFYTDPSFVLPPTDPDTSQSPDHIRKSFEEVVKEQTSAGNSKTVGKLLVSGKQELFPKRQLPLSFS